MLQTPLLSWKLLGEFGVQYSDETVPSGSNLLKRPITVDSIGSGGYLIVDDIATPSRPLDKCYRTLLFNTDLELTYDSLAHHISDGYGCLLHDDCFAVLRRSSGDILLYAPDRESTQRIELSSISKRKPWILSATHAKTFLIAFVDGIQSIDIVEVDLNGIELWRFSGPERAVGIPASLQLMSNNSILVADEFHHIVSELHRDGTSEIRWGKFHHPSSEPECLYNPQSAVEISDTELLIADTHNHRLLSISDTGYSEINSVAGQSFLSPTAAMRLPDGGLLLCDAGHRWVAAFDNRGCPVAEIGKPALREHEYSFPRSVQHLAQDHYLLADTRNNRVIEQNRGRATFHTLDTGTPLFWPRAAYMTDEKTLLIADGRNSRVLELSAQGTLIRELTRLKYRNQNIELQDPHDVRQLPNANILIVDAPQHRVLETDWEGHIVWMLNSEDIGLKDPHSAQLRSDGAVLIADTGNHRILIADPKTHDCESISEIGLQDGRRTFRHPRYVELAPDGKLLIVDSGHNRLIVTNLAQNFIWELSEIPDSPVPHLKLPRWAQLIGENEILVSDHSNHRVLYLRAITR